MNETTFEVITRRVPTMYFFGVTTGKSSSRRMFPLWAEILGVGDTELIGLDLPINGPPEIYRQAVYQIKHDPLSLGALVTTHKINTLNAARDLFDGFTPESMMTEEVSAIYKRDGRLIGHSVDPVTSGRSMQCFVPEGYWARTGADILCLGAGGSAVAITAYLSRCAPADQPRRMIVVNRSRARLDNLGRLIKERMPPSPIQFAFVENEDPSVNDRLMADLPPGSLVINATGMGKDTPGSPITDAAVFPQDGLAWELNYRGELDFMHQALAQAESRRLHVEDGWHYFLEGWSMIMGAVFDIAITPALFDKFAQAAASVR